MIFNTISFVFCYFIMNDLSIIDITWGIMFLIPAYAIVAEKFFVKNEVELSQVQMLTLFMLTMWALRLIAHLASRYNGVEDWRYTKVIRARWSGWSNFGKAIMCYHYLFVNQGILAMLVNGSTMHILKYSTMEDKLTADPVAIAGALVWTIGFACEFMADLQMLDHKDIPKNKGTLLKTGLWRYSRHPNYFGEIVCWWGMYIVACSGSSLRNGGQYTIYSALLITFLLNYVSGVPMLERSKMKSKEFRLYMAETSRLVPWFHRSIEGKERTKMLDQFEKDIKEEAKMESKKVKSGLLYWIKYYMLLEE